MSTLTATAVRTAHIDMAHSEVGFQVRHLLSKVRGRFTDFAGTITFDEAQPDQSSVQFTVRTASIDTNQPDRDTHLRSDDFFAVEQFPTLTFTSTAVRHRRGQHYDVSGDLTIRGHARPVVLSVEYLGKQDGSFQGSARLEMIPQGDLTAKLTFDRIPLARVLTLIPGAIETADGAVSATITARAPAARLQEADAWDVTGKLNVCGNA